MVMASLLLLQDREKSTIFLEIFSSDVKEESTHSSHCSPTDLSPCHTSDILLEAVIRAETAAGAEVERGHRRHWEW